MSFRKIRTILCLASAAIAPLEAFTIQSQTVRNPLSTRQSAPPTCSQLQVVTPDLDLDTVALVAGQENYGFAVVALGEAIWSFLQAPSFAHAKVLAPASIAAVILFAISGPMITSGEAGNITLGLEIATGISVLLLGSYVARMLAPSPSSKEVVFLGLLFAIAAFLSFGQNLAVNGFISLPSLPSLPLPELELGLGEAIDTSIP